MDKKTKTRNFFKAAGILSAVAMCPCIIAFGLGMVQTGPAGAEETAYGAAETAGQDGTVTEAAPQTDTDDMDGDGRGMPGELAVTEAEPGTDTETEMAGPRERAELMARIKHLSDYGNEEESNPDYRKKGYVYTEEMYYKLTGATELPDDWTDRMGLLMRGIIREEDSFEETLQTDDGATQEQWQPEGSVDTALYQVASFTGAAAPGAPGAVQAAQQRLGYPYSQAKRDSGIAYDCSSLVYWSYLDAGVNIDPEGGHTAASIAHYLESTGRGISGGELMPGDLIFYSYKQNGRYKNISHVAMVAGEGMIIHASSSQKMVVMSGLTLDRAVAVARPVLGTGEGSPAGPAEQETPDGEAEVIREPAQEDVQADYGPGMQETPESQDAQEVQDAEAPQDGQESVVMMVSGLYPAVYREPSGYGSQEENVKMIGNIREEGQI